MGARKNVLVLTYWHYSDALIQTYTLPYLRIIHQHLPDDSIIYLLTLEHTLPSRDQFDKISQALAIDGIKWMPRQYHRFGIKAIAGWFVTFNYLFLKILFSPIDVIHCWATPAGAAGYILSVLTGRRLILDSFEPHAEAMVENGTWKRGSVAFRILFWLEKKQTQRASTVIAATAGMRDYTIRKYQISPADYYVKPACVDLSLFSRNDLKDQQLLDELNLTGKIVCVYAGKLGGIYLEAEVFDFLKVAATHWGDRFRVLLLSNQPTDKIHAMCVAANLDSQIVTVRFVPHAEIPKYMGLADFGITPVKPVPTKRYCTPIKDGEYWALGLPVVIPDHISDDSEIIKQEKIGAVMSSLDTEAYLTAVAEIDHLLAMPREILFTRIRKVAETYRSFGIADAVYSKVYGH